MLELLLIVCVLAWLFGLFTVIWIVQKYVDEPKNIRRRHLSLILLLAGAAVLVLMPSVVVVVGVVFAPIGAVLVLKHVGEALTARDAKRRFMAWRLSVIALAMVGGVCFAYWVKATRAAQAVEVAREEYNGGLDRGLGEIRTLPHDWRAPTLDPSFLADLYEFAETEHQPTAETVAQFRHDRELLDAQRERIQSGPGDLGDFTPVVPTRNDYQVAELAIIDLLTRAAAPTVPLLAHVGVDEKLTDVEVNLAGRFLRRRDDALGSGTREHCFRHAEGATILLMRIAAGSPYNGWSGAASAQRSAIDSATRCITAAPPASALANELDAASQVFLVLARQPATLGLSLSFAIATAGETLRAPLWYAPDEDDAEARSTLAYGRQFALTAMSYADCDGRLLSCSTQFDAHAPHRGPRCSGDGEDYFGLCRQPGPPSRAAQTSSNLHGALALQTQTHAFGLWLATLAERARETGGSSPSRQ